MSHFAIVTPPLAGHINALSALALELIERGHRVTLVGPADAGRWLSDERIGFHLIGRDTHPAGTDRAETGRMGKLTGLFGVPRMIRDLARMTDMICREAPGAFAAIGADAVIADQLEPGGALAAEVAGLPLVTVATGLHVNAEPRVPPPFVGWRYDPSEYGEWKARGAYRVSDRLMAPIGDVLERHCRENGLPVRRDVSEWVSDRLDLLQAVGGIDYPREALPASTHYVGPLRRPDPRRFLPLDLLGRDRPLAFVSLGTLQGSRASLLKRIARAVVDCDLDLVLVHCGGLSDAEVATLPERAIVRDFVPQRAVLERADIAVLHGGFNTVLDALAMRTRIVVMPLAFEQPAIAARLERAGVGRKLSPHFATRSSIARAIRDVIADDAMRERIEGLAEEIERAGGVRCAADLIEEMIVPAVSTVAEASA